MNLVVYYVSDIEKTKKFYEMLGMQFQWEKHGEGAVHYSTVVSNMVFEIYPCVVGMSPTVIRFGLKIDSTAEIISKMELGNSGKKQAIVTDPSGNKIEVSW